MVLQRRQKLLIAATVILFLLAPVFIYRHYDLLAVAHDPQRCADARADYLKYSKYPSGRDYLGETQFCQLLESKAWIFRYLAIVFVVLGIGSLFVAFKSKNSQSGSDPTAQPLEQDQSN